jgi:hypothetical protein
MNVGRRIYWDKATGNVIQDTGERSGNVVATTVEQDFVVYASLTERVPATVGVLELDYGQYASDFQEANGRYRVDPATGKIEFAEPQTGPQVEPVYQQPLSEQIAAIKAVLDNLIFGGGL